MTQYPHLSIIIPSYNEIENIERGVLEDVLKYLKKQKYDWELILSDDGSSDGTVEFLSDFAQKDPRIIFIRNPHAGKAPTVKSGMLKATGQWRLFTDFDQSTPLSEIEKLMVFTQEYDVIIGSREGQGSAREHEPFYRHLMGRVFNFLVQILAVPGVKDTQCGFKLLSGQATDELFTNLIIYGDQQPREDAFAGAFDVELLYLARKKKYRIKEVPIIWKHAQTNRINPIKDSLRMFRDILKIKWASLQGKYLKA